MNNVVDCTISCTVIFTIHIIQLFIIPHYNKIVFSELNHILISTEFGFFFDVSNTRLVFPFDIVNHYVFYTTCSVVYNFQFHSYRHFLNAYSNIPSCGADRCCWPLHQRSFTCIMRRLRMMDCKFLPGSRYLMWFATRMSEESVRSRRSGKCGKRGQLVDRTLRSTSGSVGSTLSKCA